MIRREAVRGITNVLGRLRRAASDSAPPESLWGGSLQVRGAITSIVRVPAFSVNHRLFLISSRSGALWSSCSTRGQNGATLRGRGMISGLGEVRDLGRGGHRS